MELRWTSAALLLCLGTACVSPEPPRTRDTLRLETSPATTATALAFVCRDLFPGIDPELSPASVSFWSQDGGFRVHYARDGFGRLRMDRNTRAVLRDPNSIEEVRLEATPSTRAVGDTVLTVWIGPDQDGGSRVQIDAEDPERRLSSRLRALEVGLEALHKLDRRLERGMGKQAVYLARALGNRTDRRADGPLQTAVALLAAEAELRHGDPSRAGRWVDEVLRSGRAGHRAHDLRRRCAEVGAFAETIERDQWRRALEAPDAAERWNARAQLMKGRARPEDRVTDHLASNDREAALAWMRRWRGDSGVDTPAGARLEDLERVAGDRRAALAAGIDRAGHGSVRAVDLCAWVGDACSCGDFEGALRLLARHGDWDSDRELLTVRLREILPQLDPRIVVSVIASEGAVGMSQVIRHLEGFDDPALWRPARRRLRRPAAWNVAAPMDEPLAPALRVAPR